MNRHTNELLDRMVLILSEGFESEDYDMAVKNLLAGWEDKGYEGLSLAAYKLEPKVPKPVLIGAIKELIRKGMLDGTKIELTPKQQWSLNHYADNLRFGK